jgi:putative transposase
MHRLRPSRLPGFSYLGRHAYSVTICTSEAAPALDSSVLVSELLEQLRQHVEAEQVALVAYCFMPDHVHLVLQGLSDASDLRRLIARWKQMTGYRHKQRTGRALWRSGYYDRILRDGDSILDMVGYALRNPVREGLAARIGDYPFAGSDVYGLGELREVLAEQA